jgi:hypothetical protein
VRNRISNPKKLRHLEALVGKPIALVLTRGGTQHRIDIACEDGTVYEYYPGRGAPMLTPHRYEPGVGIRLFPA